MAKRSKRRSRRAHLRQAARRAALALAAVGGVVALIAGALVYRELQRSLPPLTAIADYRPPVTTQVLAEDGTVLAEFYSEKRYLVPLERIPQVVRQAFIAAEDDAFYSHHGIDPMGIARAFIQNLTAGGRVQGGSTITQQVVKTILLTSEKSYERKIKEILLALRLERTLSKDQILWLYLNHIYLGSGAYGVAAAARQYFGKDVEDLDLAEAALLAGLPQAPSRYSPLRHWARAKARQRYVLDRMVATGFITPEEHDAALLQPIALVPRSHGSFREAPYFVEYVRRSMERRYGQATLYEAGLRIHTTLDVTMHRAARAALRRGLEELSARHDGYRSSFRAMDPEARKAYLEAQERLLSGESLQPLHSYEAIVTGVGAGGVEVKVGPFNGILVPDPRDGQGLPELRPDDVIRVRLLERSAGELRFAYDPTPLLEGALIAMDPHTGYVKAMIGGYDFRRSSFNRAVQARRQPGSAFKPLVYAAAFDKDVTPATVVIDEPIYYQFEGKVWAPENFENEFFGPTRVREALVHSRNVATVKVADHIGIGYLIRYLRRFGLTRPLPPNLSIALGSAEVSPLELAVAYATLAGGGRRPKPIFVTEVTDTEGHVLEENRPRSTPAIPADVAYLVTSILQDVVARGTGRRAGGLGQPTAGKTGTTNDQHDAWFVGYTPQLLAAVWVGFDVKRTLGRYETGGRVAAPIWKEFMAAALQGVPPGSFPVPPGIRCLNIDPETGARAVAGEKSIIECFRAGTEPGLGVAPVLRSVDHKSAPAPDRGFLLDDF